MYPLITLEEHYLDKSLVTTQEDEHHFAQFPPQLMEKLTDLGDDRINSLSDTSIALQVLSHAPVTDPTPEQCRSANDKLHQTVQSKERYAAFALLPMTEPSEAAKELTRCVQDLHFLGALVSNHTGNGTFYNTPAYDPFWSAAQTLDVPIYIHPTFAPESLLPHYTSDAYPQVVGEALSTFAWGWHVDTGLHFLRLYSSGLFDRFPKLKIVLGHMGEMLPYQIHRTGPMLQGLLGDKVTRSVQEVWNSNLWITTSGMFSLSPFRCLIDVCKKERVLLSVDYPFSANEKGEEFVGRVRESGLLSEEELRGFAYGNAERLLGVKVGE